MEYAYLAETKSGPGTVTLQGGYHDIPTARHQDVIEQHRTDDQLDHPDRLIAGLHDACRYLSDHRDEEADSEVIGKVTSIFHMVMPHDPTVTGYLLRMSNCGCVMLSRHREPLGPYYAAKTREMMSEVNILGHVAEPGDRMTISCDRADHFLNPAEITARLVEMVGNRVRKTRRKMRR